MSDLLILLSACTIGGLLGLAIAGAQEPESETWTLPSCPLEITLRDGTRWAKPQWAEPECKAVIGWTNP